MNDRPSATVRTFEQAWGLHGAAKVRSVDWAATPLGPRSDWPASLKVLADAVFASPVPMVLLWSQAGYMLYNDGYAAVIGGHHPAASGASVFDVFPDFIDLNSQVLATCLHGGTLSFREREIAFDRGEGPELLFLDLDYSPAFDDAGRPAGALAVVVERTDRVAAARAAEIERQRHRAMLDQMPGFAAVLLGREHRYDYVNDAYREIGGDRQFIGRTVREVFPDIAEQGFYELLDRVYATGEPFAGRAMPIRLDRADGERFIDLLYDPIRDDAGQVFGIFVGGYDVTERVRAERRTEALLALDDRLRDLHDPPEMEHASAELLGKVLGACRAGYGDFDAEARTITVGGAWTLPGTSDVAGVHRFADYGSYVEELLRGETVAVADVTTDPRTADKAAAFRALGIAAHLDVPVVEDGRTVGSAFVHSAEPRAWHPDEAALARDFATRTRAVVARRRAEAALREKELRLRAVQDASVDGFMLLDSVRDDAGRIVDFRWVHANAAAGRIIGRPASWFDGRCMIAEMPGNREEGLFDAYVRVVETGEPWTGEFSYCRDGVDVFLRAVAAKAGDGFAIGFADLSERRRVEEQLREGEERYRRLFESIDEGFCVVEFIDGPHGPMSDYVHVEANPAYERHAGISGIVGKTGRSELTDSEADAWVAVFRRVLETGEPLRFEREFEAQRRYLEVACFRVEPATRRQVAVIFQDVSARKQAEQALRDLNETLERRVAERTADLEAAHEQLRQSQKLEAMGQLTGGVAHDFNNLLTPIVGGLDMLRRRGLGGEREQRMIAAGLESAERAKTLVHRLLAFARRQPLQPEPIDVGAIVRGMADLVASTSGPQVKLAIDVAEDLPPALADSNQVEMAILNLAVNARDAMPDGGRLTIMASTDTAGGRHPAGLQRGRYVRLSVADSGIGMDEATVKRAIEPFFSTKGVGRGTGLGLSMVHGLAAQSGGAIRIDSKPGLGTRVDVWLPVADVKPRADERSIGSDASGASGTVLLVDDEELARLSTADMLIDMGYSVVEADSAEAALRLIDNGLRVELLMTDHLMPGLSGIELMQRVRASQPALPMLLVSGYAEGDGVPAELPRLTKPFTHAELVETLAAMSQGSDRMTGPG